MDIDDLIALFENPIVSVSATILALIIFGLVLPAYWVYLFSIVVSYVLTDVLLSLFIVGGNGIAQIPIFGSEAQHKGHSYLAFMVGMIGATLLSVLLSDFMLGFTQTQVGWTNTVLGLSALVGVLAYADLEARFYERD